MKPKKSLSVSEKAELNRSVAHDPLAYLRRESKAFSEGVNKCTYRGMQAAALLMIFYDKNPKRGHEIRALPMFAKREDTAGLDGLIMQAIEGADSKYGRKRANQHAKAVRKLLDKGVGPTSIAEELDRRGGPSGVLGLKGDSARHSPMLVAKKDARDVFNVEEDETDEEDWEDEPENDEPDNDDYDGDDSDDEDEDEDDADDEAEDEGDDDNDREEGDVEAEVPDGFEALQVFVKKKVIGEMLQSSDIVATLRITAGENDDDWKTVKMVKWRKK